MALSFASQEECVGGEMWASYPKGPGMTFSLLVSYPECLVREDEQDLKEFW